MNFYIVGSALTKENPRDVDMLGVMEDQHFRSTFSMSPIQFIDEGKTGNWSEGRHKWKEQCIGATRVLQFVFPELVPLDFKFVPESLVIPPYLEVDLTKKPRDWGIGLPNLALHGV